MPPAFLTNTLFHSIGLVLKGDGFHPNNDPAGKLNKGHLIWRNTRSDVLPRSPSRNPSGPSVVITTRSAEVSPAVSRMLSTASLSWFTRFQIQLGVEGISTAGASAGDPACSRITSPPGSLSAEIILRTAS